MRFIVSIIAALVLVATAQAGAGNANLCVNGGWATAQSGSGQAFSSMKECVQSKEVFRPTLTLFPDHEEDHELFSVTGAGFHTNQQDLSATLAFAVTGQEPYFYLGVGLKKDGSFYHLVQFDTCAPGVTYDLTLTLIDASGVHASATLELCG